MKLRTEPIPAVKKYLKTKFRSNYEIRSIKLTFSPGIGVKSANG